MDKEEIIEKSLKIFRTYFNEKEGHKYKNLITDFAVLDKPFVIDYRNISAYEPELAEALLENPEDVISAMEEAVKLFYEEVLYEYPKKPIKVHIHNLSKTILVKDLAPEYINKFVQVEGIVVLKRDPEDYPYYSVFICKDCGNEMALLQKPYLPFVKPKKCEDCGSRDIELDLEKSKWMPHQIIRVQDLYENLQGNETPRYVEVIILDDLVDKVNAGDKVRITAVYKVLPRKEAKFSTFKRILVANWIEKDTEDYERIEITKEDEEKILELAQRPDIVERITKSIAPEVYGYEEVKLGLALALFGGNEVVLNNKTRLRGISHVLLVGDPGLAKSQLLKSIVNITPRSIYTSGKGVSAAGLTASAVRDELTGSWILEAGVLVLADGGVAAIDELEKMSSKDRSAIHEAMEQNTVSVAKAGITVTLNARTTIIAAANPIAGKFLPEKLLTEQIDLPPTLISRFDLIFILRDEPNPVKDSLIAQHIFKVRQQEEVDIPIPFELLKKYIAYAKRNIKPKFSREAMDKAIKYYVDVRTRTKNTEEENDVKTLPITPRQLEAIIRLSEAYAKMRLSPIVEKSDVQAVIKLLEYTWRDMLLDPETGEIDYMILEMGQSMSSIKKAEKLMDLIKALDDGQGVSYIELLKEAKKQGLSKKDVDKGIAFLEKKKKIFSTVGGLIKISSL